MNEGLSVADAIALSKDNDGFGDGNGSWWVILLILLFVGWGGNGFGGGFGGNGFFPACAAPATAQGVTDAFNFSQLNNDINGVHNAITDGFNTQNVSFLTANGQNQLQMCQGFNSVNQAIAANGFNTQQSFCDVQRSILNSDYQTLLGMNNLSHQLDSCCCDIERGQDDIKYLMASNLNTILVENDKNTDRIINYLTNAEMDKLRTDLQTANFQISQQAQTESIINQLMPVAKPAYLTLSPYTALNSYNPYGYGNGYGYGCGCGM
jgi:hypothetical protein